MSTNFKFKMAATSVILAGLLAGPVRGDFTLYDNEQITVDTHHDWGYLYDSSRATIVSGGEVGGSSYEDGGLYAYDSSAVDISGGWVRELWAQSSSTVNVFSGTTHEIDALDSSTVNVSGGYMFTLFGSGSSVMNVSGTSGMISKLCPYGASVLNFSGGSSYGIIAAGSGVANICGGDIESVIYTDNSSTVNIFGGRVGQEMESRDSSTVNIYGGYIPSGYDIWAFDYTTITFYGQNFQLGEGLYLDGKWRILGTGVLSGEWMDGTPWTVGISRNDPTATILIPEPATLTLIGLGSLMLVRRRRRS